MKVLAARAGRLREWGLVIRGPLAKSLGYLAMVTATDKRTVFSSQALLV